MADEDMYIYKCVYQQNLNKYGYGYGAVITTTLPNNILRIMC